MLILSQELSKQYDPKQVEDRTYQFWEEAGYFHTAVDPSKKPYTIVMPPPNITGQLHIGHALDNTLQDILIRWRRMQGYAALWIPGTDHASIATEVKIVESMREEGVTKDDLGRDGFLERAWVWKENYGGRITQQLRKMGSSCDWQRERFTMDEGCSKAVREVFCRMYEKELIYRGERIINWCPVCRTSISDAEVEYQESPGFFWHIRYPYADGSGYVEIATTRPETLLGDTAVAVNPSDERYKDCVGKMLKLPLTDREIPVVADRYVEMDFGTGAVKITPAHDPNDFEVGQRHDLPIINIFNADATVNENGGKYQGMSREAARKAVVADLEEAGFLVRAQEHTHNVGTCYRCHTVIEPRISLQWFVKMEPLAKPAVEVVKNHQIQILPERFEKTYFNWMDNTRDWCISRQLWWGHRIPVWYCNECGELTVAKEDPTCCSHCQSTDIVQDPDTLDTWFSSALWPFSTLGWPDDTEDLKFFYPTNTLVTAYDILTFWVSRMIFSALEQTEQAPFDTVFIHGLIRDGQGRKISKSLGNGIDPLEIIDQYGADALRFSLTTGVSPGNDLRFSDEKVLAARNFANKIWNAVRYVLMNLDGEYDPDQLPAVLALEDKWILSQFNRLVGEVTTNLERFELGVAAQKLYDFIWDVYCDWYIEITKARIQQGGDTARDAQQILVYVLTRTLQLLHPFMPFLSEELWQALPHHGDSIMVSAWPTVNGELAFEKEEEEFSIVLDAIRGIRTRRSEMNVPPSKKAMVQIETTRPDVFIQGIPFIERLAFAQQVKVGEHFTSEKSVQVVTDAARILIPMEQLIDKDKERQRLQKELETAQKEINMLEGKLSNEQFVSKAPAAVVEGEREKLQKAKDLLNKVQESLATL